MRHLWRITSALLVALLVVWTGASVFAYDLSDNCPGGHCDSRLVANNGVHHSGQDLAVLGADHDHYAGGSAHGQCDPSLCQVLAFSPQLSVVMFSQTVTVLEWRVAQLSALLEPDFPDRPPNL